MKGHLNMQIPQSSGILGNRKSTIVLVLPAGDDHVRGYALLLGPIVDIAIMHGL